MKKVIFLMISIAIFASLLLIGWLGWKGYSQKKMMAKVSTYKIDYSQDENPKVKIENLSDEKFCFSTCYPYYLERNQEGKFKSYEYGACPEQEKIDSCIEPGTQKSFELFLNKSEIKKGLHRIAIPACVGCLSGGNFTAEKWFYSNPFNIK